MKKIFLTFGLMATISTSSLALVTCGSKVQKKIYKSSFSKDEEGFPIHLGTEFIEGQGDLSVGRIAKHLQKYLKVAKNGSKIKSTSLRFEKFSKENLWDEGFFDDTINDAYNKKQGKSLWSSGYSNEKIIKNEKEYVEDIKKNKGWERFINKKTKKFEFNILFNAYPLLEKPKEMKVQIIIVDKKYKKYFKYINLDNITGIIEEKIPLHKDGSKKVADNPEEVKKIIKDLANLNSWKNLLGLIPTEHVPKKAIDVMMSKILSEKENKKIIEDNIDEIYNLFVESPYIDVNNKDILLSKKYFDKHKVVVTLNLMENIKNIRDYFMYIVFSLANYIEQKMIEQKEKS